MYQVFNLPEEDAEFFVKASYHRNNERKNRNNADQEIKK
jgi:hypothetical protein